MHNPSAISLWQFELHLLLSDAAPDVELPPLHIDILPTEGAELTGADPGICQYQQDVLELLVGSYL